MSLPYDTVRFEYGYLLTDDNHVKDRDVFCKPSVSLLLLLLDSIRCDRVFKHIQVRFKAISPRLSVIPVEYSAMNSSNPWTSCSRFYSGLGKEDRTPPFPKPHRVVGSSHKLDAYSSSFLSSTWRGCFHISAGICSSSRAPLLFAARNPFGVSR